MRYRVFAEKTNGGDTVILAHTDSPGLARIIAEHIALTHRGYALVAVQELMRGRGWRTVRAYVDEMGAAAHCAARQRTIQINDTLVRYTPA